MEEEIRRKDIVIMGLTVAYREANNYMHRMRRKYEVMEKLLDTCQQTMYAVENDYKERREAILEGNEMTLIEHDPFFKRWYKIDGEKARRIQERE